MVEVPCDPIHHSGETARRLRNRVNFAVVPNHREREACERIPCTLTSDVPRAHGATIVRELAKAARQAGNQRFAHALIQVFARRYLAYLSDHRPQHRELTVRKELAPLRETVSRNPHAQRRLSRHWIVGHAKRHVAKQRVNLSRFNVGNLDLMFGRQAILLAPLTINDDDRHPPTETRRLALDAQVFHRQICATTRALGTALVDRSIPKPVIARRDIRFDAEIEPSTILPQRHRQENPLVGLPAQPTGLQQWNRGPAIPALRRPCPQVGNGRLGNPTGPALILEVFGVELGVQGRRGDAPIRIGNQQLRWARFEPHGRQGRNACPTLALDRFELGVSGVSFGQFPRRAVQDAPSPGSKMPGEVGFRLWRVERD